MVSANQESKCAGGEQGESLDRLRAMRTGLLFLVPFFGACESARLVCVCMCVWFEHLSACVYSHAPFGRLGGGWGVTLPFNISAVSAISNTHRQQAATVFLNINLCAVARSYLDLRQC